MLKIPVIGSVLALALLASAVSYGQQPLAKKTAIEAATAKPPTGSEQINTISFGSCLKGWHSTAVLSAIAATNPDLFIFTGDNVYADTTDPIKLAQSYQTLGQSPHYQALAAATPIVATWDDHDYGINDGGAEHPTKAAAQQVLLDFFGEPGSSPRRGTEGVYTSYQLGPKGQRVQVILLDTRYFRSPLKAYRNALGKKHFQMVEVANPTILGEAQWQWLQQQLKQPADVRVIVSSIQVLSDKQRFEKWGNYSHERDRLLAMLDLVDTGQLVLVSGDRHFSELSAIDLPSGKKVYEVTSSGLNTGGNFGQHEDNPYRVKWVKGQGFASLAIDWSNPLPVMSVVYKDTNGKPTYQQVLN